MQSVSAKRAAFGGTPEVGMALVPEGMKSEVVRGFPWLAFGCRIVLRRLKPREMRTDGGIVIPEISDEEQWTQGRIVAMGVGEWVPYAGFISPALSYRLRLNDIVFCETRAGVPLKVDGIEYWAVRPEDIVMVLRDDKGQKIRERFDRDTLEIARKHQDLGVLAGEAVAQSVMPPLPSKRDIEGEVEQIVAARQEKRGKRLKAGALIENNPLAKA